MAARTKKKHTRTRQKMFAGTQSEADMQIQEAIDNVLDCKKEKRVAKENLEIAEESLITTMERKRKKAYVCDGYEATIVPKGIKIKVYKKPKKDGQAEGQASTMVETA